MCEQAKDTFFFPFLSLKKGKKKSHTSSVCDVSRAIVYIIRLIASFSSSPTPPVSFGLSAGRLDSGDGWFVKKHSIAKSRSFSVTSSQGEREERHTRSFFPPKTYSSKALLPRLTLTFLSFFPSPLLTILPFVNIVGNGE